MHKELLFIGLVFSLGGVTSQVSAMVIDFLLQFKQRRSRRAMERVLGIC